MFVIGLSRYLISTYNFNEHNFRLVDLKITKL